jgi:WD40 repeat protein
MQMRGGALLVAAVAVCLPCAASADSFKPGDDVLVRYQGKLTIGWVVAKEDANRSVVAFTWDARRLLTVPDKELRSTKYGKAPSRKVIRGWTGHEAGLYRIDTSPGGRFMAAAPHKGPIQIFRQDVLLPVTQIPSKNGVAGLAISPDGTKLVVCDRRGTLRVHSLPKGTLLRAKAVGTGCRHLTFGGKNLVAFEVTKPRMALRLFDTNTGKLSMRRMGIRVPWQRRSALRLSEDGKWLLDARDTQKKFRGKRGVRVYQVGGSRLKNKRVLGGISNVASLTMSRDGTIAVAGGRGGKVVGWRLDTGKILWKQKLGIRGAQVALSPTGTTVAVCAGNKASSIELRSAKTGKLRTRLGKLPRPCQAIRFSGDGKALYTSVQLFSNMAELAVYRFAVPAGPSASPSK